MSVPISDFLAECEIYHGKLRAASTFEEILTLWRNKSVPYKLESVDPLSASYKAEVIAVYESLAQSSYVINNELSSTKQGADDFKKGYPWVSGNLEIVAQELAKTTQAMRAMATGDARVQSILEFGCGWGNLSIPLAKAGQDVTVVDIDEGFLLRAQETASKDACSLTMHCGDFLEVAKNLTRKYDSIVFQSSFHHCLDFEVLLQVIGDSLLKENGKVYFLSEPVFKDYAFPWGLRYDGESLWAIMCNKWLELGFDEDFFLDLLVRSGLLASRVPSVPGYVGEGWLGRSAKDEVALFDCVFSSRIECGMWPSSGAPWTGRFLRQRALLPQLNAASQAVYVLRLRNFAPISLAINLVGDAGSVTSAYVEAGGEVVIRAPRSVTQDLSIESQTFVPDLLIGNGDPREVGLAFVGLSLSA